MNKQSLLERFKHVVIFDGAMGTELYRRNFFVNCSYESLCLSRPEVIRSIHNDYRDAGADILTTNSYAANTAKLGQFGIAERFEEINTAAVRLARETASDDMLVAASVGPAGEISNADSVIADHALALAKSKPDFILFETLSSLSDLEHAVYASQLLPKDMEFMFSFALNENAETEQGESIQSLLDEIGMLAKKPFSLGLNCLSGPANMLKALQILVSHVNDIPIVVQPNAGQPQNVDHRMLYMSSPEYFSTYAMRYYQLGAKGIGGCCGISPEHIQDMARSVKPMGKSHVSIAEKEAEVPLQAPTPTAEKSSFAKKLKSGEWVHTIEIVPPQGYLLEKTLERARQCMDYGFDAVNIPDGPRATSRISALTTAFMLKEKVGVEVILHCCCRDKNIIGLQSDLLSCAALGIRNILFITGDPPKLGDYAFASGVFDVDSIGTVKIQSRLNQGVDFVGKSIGPKTEALMLVGADPNAVDRERELRRTREKIAAGAEVVVTQPVFDVRSLEKFIADVPELASGEIPVIAGIWPLASYRNALFMKNEVPGVVVPEEVMQRMAQAETKEAQRDVGIAIAAEAVAAIRGLVAGVQISAPFGNVSIAAAVKNYQA